MSRLLVFPHVAAESLGTLDPLIRRRGHRIRFKNSERHPDAQLNIDRYRGLITQMQQHITAMQQQADAVFNNFLDLAGRPQRRHTLPSREWV